MSYLGIIIWRPPCTAYIIKDIYITAAHSCSYINWSTQLHVSCRSGVNVKISFFNTLALTESVKDSDRTVIGGLAVLTLL